MKSIPQKAVSSSTSFMQQRPVSLKQDGKFTKDVYQTEANMDSIGPTEMSQMSSSGFRAKTSSHKIQVKDEQNPYSFKYLATEENSFEPHQQNNNYSRSSSKLSRTLLGSKIKQKKIPNTTDVTFIQNRAYSALESKVAEQHSREF